MPEPIQSSLDSHPYSAIDGGTAEESAGQVCLPPSPSPPPVNTSPSDLPGPRVSTEPAHTALVARFTKPIGVHPPVVPSLGKALADCGWEVAGAVVSAGGALGADGFSMLIPGARAAISIGSANRCVERDEAKQIADGVRDNQIADCKRDGLVPLKTADDGVICANPNL